MSTKSWPTRNRYIVAEPPFDAGKWEWFLTEEGAERRRARKRAAGTNCAVYILIRDVRFA